MTCSANSPQPIQDGSASPPLGVPRPLGRTLGWSVATLLLHYGWYKWVIQDELRAYRGTGWSGMVSLVPFLVGIAGPLLVTWLVPAVSAEWAGLALLGVIWIYIVQFRLYRTVNELYGEAGLKPPLVVWWLFVPGLNLVVGLRQIHFLSEYWVMKSAEPSRDRLGELLPFLFGNT